MSGSVACAARQKADLRRELRQRCRELPEEYCRSADRAIARSLFEAPAFAGARQIFCFVGKAGEIDTLPLLRRILEQGSSLCVPLCLEPGRMEARLLRDLEDLVPGRYGILGRSAVRLWRRPAWIWPWCPAFPLPGRDCGWGRGAAITTGIWPAAMSLPSCCAGKRCSARNCPRRIGI